MYYVSRALRDHMTSLSAVAVDTFTLPRLVQTLSGSLSAMRMVIFGCMLLASSQLQFLLWLR